MPAVNSSFPPFNPDVTTDDVTYTAAWIAVMSITLGLVTMFSFNWHWRSFWNLVTDEYHNHRDASEKNNLMTTGAFLWFSYWANPLLSMFFMIGFTIWTWVVYSQQSNGVLNVPRDVLFLGCTIIYGAWLFIMYSVCIADIIWKKSLVTQYLNDGAKASEIVKMNMAHLSSIDNLSYHGMNGTTTVYFRKIILITNSALWGLFPLYMTLIGISWDRGSQTYPKSYIGDTQAAFTGTAGLLFTLAWLWHCVVIVRNAPTLYKKETLGFRPSIMTEANLNLLTMGHVGLAVDTVGLRAPFKGSIPYQYIPRHMKNAKFWLNYALGFLIWNDELQATAWFFGTSVIPYTLSLYAQSDIYYITYDVLCTYYILVFSYWLQGVAYYRDTPENINCNLLTLNQSATYPGMAPTEYYGTSIAVVYGLAFAFCLLTFGKTVTTKPIPDMTPYDEEEESGFIELTPAGEAKLALLGGRTDRRQSRSATVMPTYDA